MSLWRSERTCYPLCCELPDRGAGGTELSPLQEQESLLLLRRLSSSCVELFFFFFYYSSHLFTCRNQTPQSQKPQVNVHSLFLVVILFLEIKRGATVERLKEN